MKLPVDFLAKMEKMLGKDEFAAFVKSYEDKRYYGLRVNTLKIGIDEFKAVSPFEITPIPWTKDGFYYPEGNMPGRHPYYHAGLYYIQEPSAMLPGAVIDAQPGEYVLDLCAAPGGKTVQIASSMQGKGLLIANDISSDRIKPLVKNIELCGVTNAVVTNETPDRLADKFIRYFDRILVDAPCSGEGMFRKDEEAAKSWEKFKCEKCSGMQWDIMQHVDRMLKPGGTVVYSTCTFSAEEDEVIISRFLKEHEDYEILNILKTGGIDNGRPEWAAGDPRLAGTARLWPHKLKGEGHFVAALKKKTDGHEGDIQRHVQRSLNKPGNMDERLKPFHDFEDEYLNVKIPGELQINGNNIYCLPEAFPDLNRIRVTKLGWYLGEIKGGRFEPSHSLAVALKKSDIRNTIEFSSESKELFSYLKGETLLQEAEKGYCAVCADGYTVGWVKQAGHILKNLYPKGWRKMS